LQQSNAEYLSHLGRAFRSRVSRYAYYGLAVALAAVLLATVCAVALAGEPLTLANLYDAQSGNPALLVMDAMPFVFALWGQYVHVLLSHEAGDTLSDDQAESRRSDKIALQAEARRLEQQDALTGLSNRAHYIEQLEASLVSAHLNRTRLGVMVLDLDGFSEVNDQFGAANGDRVLKSVARRLSNAVENTAVVLARLGGDSFGLLIEPLQSGEVLEDLARRLQEVLEPPCTLDQLSLNLGASIGASVYPDNARDAYALLNAADGAMQHAKSAGGGFEQVKAEITLQDAEMHSLSAELRTAIDEDQLVLFMQPLIDSKTSKVGGLEALVRWQHPRRGLLGPGEFIPRAERSGLIKDLSNWVLRRALKYVSELRSEGYRLGVSVNLSARSLLDPEFPDLLSGLLEAYEVPSEVLTLEITEDTLMSDQRRTMDIVTRVANMGVHISIDDFGTGYSQLTYLKQLPAAEIKIDRSFVQDMLESPTDMAIVQATIGLGHALGLRAVGEGVEKQEHMRKLTELGCDILQGFYIGRPMPIEKLRPWLDEWQLHHEPQQTAAISMQASEPSRLN
jgi:diguanylate cyclase (GGDEF)-like protein